MNIFLPYEDDVIKSVESLDDVRLNKQAVECYQLLVNAIKEKNGETIKGYRNHPVYLFYKNNPDFLAYYCLCCCYEYSKRFRKVYNLLSSLRGIAVLPKDNDVLYTPYYMEGSKGQPNYIRTTKNVSALFQSKLCKKWDTDKEKGRPPKWTNRQVPEFYIQHLQEEKEYDSQ